MVQKLGLREQQNFLLADKVVGRGIPPLSLLCRPHVILVSVGATSSYHVESQAHMWILHEPFILQVARVVVSSMSRVTRS